MRVYRKVLNSALKKTKEDKSDRCLMQKEGVHVKKCVIIPQKAAMN